MFSSHFKMNRECPSCHVVFWKDQGESLGAMYVDYAIAFSFFLIAWALLAYFTNWSETAQLVILSMVVAGSVFLFYPLSRSLWTLLIYISGGIEGPRIRVIPGRRKTPR